MTKLIGCWTVLLTLAMAGIVRGQSASEKPQEAGIEGFTEPIRKLDLIPPEQGIISSLKVHEGDRVEKNQLLGSLDCDTQQIALAIAKNNMEAHGRLDSAKAERDLRQWRLVQVQKTARKGSR